MSGRFSRFRAAASIAALVAAIGLAQAQDNGGFQTAAPGAATAGYDLISRNDGGVELRFHNMPIKGVHADDSQNALAVDFQNPVDGAAFDKLAKDFPDWITMAYASYDTGVIRATRRVTFLTRAESDGFSLRIVPRTPTATAAPTPLPLRGNVDGPPGPAPIYPTPPPPQQPYPVGPQPLPPAPHFSSYAAMRNYDAQQLALHRGDPVWGKAYQRAAQQGDSEVDFGSEAHFYHRGDRVIASQLHAKLELGGGLALVGTVYDTDAHADTVRAPNGAFVSNVNANRVGGAAGLAFDAWNDSEISLQATQNNNILGGKLSAYTGDPDGWWLADISYHQADMDTPEAIFSHGLKDEAVFATGQQFFYGLWAGAAGRVANYGVHGDANAVETAGWDGNLHWAYDFGGWLAGLSYDGHGEYIWQQQHFVGATPSPYTPLSIRNMETHAFTASLSSQLWSDAFWFDLYGGYVTDRYATDGALYGLSLHYRPFDGVDFALGARHSTVSLIEGELGAQTTAGLSLTLGFNGVPVSNYF